MTALEAVAVHLPHHAVPIEAVGDRIGLTPRQLRLFRRFHGLDQLRLDPDGTLPDLLDAAVEALPQLRGRERHVRFVIHARSMPVAVPYPLNPLHDLIARRGLSRAVAFTVTHHACAVGLLAVDLAGRLLSGCPDPDALALVLAGEKTFTKDAQVVPETGIFAEGAAACLVRASGERDRVLSFAVRQRPEFDGRLAGDAELLARYQREYPAVMIEALEAALDQAGLDLSDLAAILPHNVNQASWRMICRRIGYPVEKVVLDNVRSVGHSFAADSLINLHTATTRGLLRRGDRYLIAAAGVGATFSAMAVEH
ncbi:3-oxoacyl-[acyl-carrier-protein] synthase III C-terminal domain-containing protein [Kitasatospora sp. CM 4170]|uniref:3-oxoacyl-[acyl-carrier-protein] synthase III C-terminal domain-containing protein n=1 Tax=Kitasatospora aburaviensis TaxID=67265 RepID=A0ABW1F2A0_9ACTN|nr:3-oxoacyl-[acyl-carrier-protein] synthase III C-terminal domain-containing protein [Kitasatospora sp. CM 4170]WNM49458.1 3-oxoacyl-[acyl-carrier-protein] synthase III C-terminal domain-containing protein [Kitasatospora sp. CM 4170]